MNTETKKAIIKALEEANLDEIYKKTIGLSVDETGFSDNLYPLVYYKTENKLSFLKSKPEESENIIFLGNFSANDLLHNDPISLIFELLNS